MEVKMPELKAKIVTTLKNDKIQGNLFFTSGEKNITVKYIFNENPKKSLERGDNLNLSFYFKEAEHLVKGTYPQVLENISRQSLCAWSLSRDKIYEHIFFFMNTNIGDEKLYPIEYSREISGNVSDEVIQSLFD